MLRLLESAKTLELLGNKITFRDLRAGPLAEAELEELLVELGDRTTNDYRTLNTWLKNSEVDAQISSKPKVMATPSFKTRIASI